MFGMSLGHMMILLVILLLFGAKRLPELGSSLGKGLRAFKKGLEGLDEEKTPAKLNPPTGSVAQRDESDKKDDPSV